MLDFGAYGKAIEKSETLKRLLGQLFLEVQKHYSDEKSTLGQLMREVMNQARNARSDVMKEMNISFAEKQMIAGVANTTHMQLSNTTHLGKNNGET